MLIRIIAKVIATGLKVVAYIPYRISTSKYGRKRLLQHYAERSGYIESIRHNFDSPDSPNTVLTVGLTVGKEKVGEIDFSMRSNGGIYISDIKGDFEGETISNFIQHFIAQGNEYLKVVNNGDYFEIPNNESNDNRNPMYSRW